MPYTMQQVVDMGRIPLNDGDKQRADDPTLLTYAVMALQKLLLARPDLFYGQFNALPVFTALTLVSNFPLDDTIAPSVADYITARAETSNDESVIEQRATLFFSLFQGET